MKNDMRRLPSGPDRVNDERDSGGNSDDDAGSRLRALARRAVERREEERRELAARLQEDVAQQIAGCLLKLKAARGPSDAETRDALLDDLREEAAAALESVRLLARGLHPPELADVGVGRAVEALARSFADTTGLPVAVEREAVGGSSSDEAQLALYRIVQELLLGAVQRADPDPIRIRVRPEGDLVVLEVVRTPPPRVARASELFEVRERAAYAGGRVIVEEAGGRDRIRVEVPREEAAA